MNLFTLYILAKGFEKNHITKMCSNVVLLALAAFAFVAVSVEGQGSTPKPSSAGPSTIKPSTNASKQSSDAIRAEIKEQVTRLTQSCKKSSIASPDDLKIITNENIPKTDGEKCLLQCIYTGLGILKNDQFSVDGSKILAQKRFINSPEELTKANQMIDICSKEVAAAKKDSKEKCLNGKLIRECFAKNGAKINFFPKA